MRGNAYQKIIRPENGWLSLDLNELWRYRELFWFLALRDILIRYKQAFIGVAWAVVQPVLTMIVFTFVFGKIAKLPSDGVPYPVLIFAALLPWQFFANTMRASSQSVVANSNLITKIYFPRLIIPTSAVISGLIDFLISFGILIMMMIWYKVVPTGNIIFLPFFLFLAFLASLGMGLWLAALNVKYRDVVYVVPFLIQAGQFISPVAYSSSIVPNNSKFLYSLNPMVSVIDGFRWTLLNARPPDLESLLLSFFMVIVLFLSGLFYFRKMEKTFADVI